MSTSSKRHIIIGRFISGATAAFFFLGTFIVYPKSHSDALIMLAMGCYAASVFCNPVALANPLAVNDLQRMAILPKSLMWVAGLVLLTWSLSRFLNIPL